jgi:three-Cys-motif partner protein
MAEHTFGGDWTADKLDRVRKYLCAYTNIFEKNERARHFTTIYVDAFAGTGQRSARRSKTSAGAFGSEGDTDAESLQKGSARIALEVESPFDRFLFIEQRADRVSDLQDLRTEFPNRAKAIQIEQGDANDVLKKWCRESDWHHHRAVVFLDPYGMQVNWETVAAIASTKAIDLWILFPLGMAINRLLTRRMPPQPWARALTRIFGSEEWRAEFYPKKKQKTLFEDEETEFKETSFERIGRFFLKRLNTVFTRVAPNPLILTNSKRVPIFLLCFAAGNPKGAPTAVKIAGDILK